MTPQERAAAITCDHIAHPRAIVTGAACRACIASAIEEAVKEEREACAALVDSAAAARPGYVGLYKLARAIRERGTR